MHEMEKNIFLIFIFTKVERRRIRTRRHRNIHRQKYTPTPTAAQFKDEKYGKIKDIDLCDSQAYKIVCSFILKGKNVKRQQQQNPNQ